MARRRRWPARLGVGLGFQPNMSVFLVIRHLSSRQVLQIAVGKTIVLALETNSVARLHNSSGMQPASFRAIFHYRYTGLPESFRASEPGLLMENRFHRAHDSLTARRRAGIGCRIPCLRTSGSQESDWAGRRHRVCFRMRGRRAGYQLDFYGDVDPPALRNSALGYNFDRIGGLRANFYG